MQVYLCKYTYILISINILISLGIIISISILVSILMKCHQWLGMKMKGVKGFVMVIG